MSDLLCGDVFLAGAAGRVTPANGGRRRKTTTPVDGPQSGGTRPAMVRALPGALYSLSDQAQQSTIRWGKRKTRLAGAPERLVSRPRRDAVIALPPRSKLVAMRVGLLPKLGRGQTLNETMYDHRIRETGLTVNDRSDYEAHLNRSLDDVISLLEREIRRLKESLETYRLSQHPDRGEIIRWHVRTLDERQDALERLQGMLMAQREESGVTKH
jgi:hypothetical protein